MKIERSVSDIPANRFAAVRIPRHDLSTDLPLVVTLEDISIAEILKLRLEEERVLRTELELELSVSLRPRDVVIRPQVVKVLVLRIECVREVTKGSKLGRRLPKLPVAVVLARRGDSESVCFEELGVLLLRDELRERAAAHR